MGRVDVAALFIFCVACGGSEPSRRASVEPRASARALPDEHVCREADAALGRMEKNERAIPSGLVHCWSADIEAASRSCPRLDSRARALLKRIETSVRAGEEYADITVSDDGRWAIRSSAGITNVFELTPQGAIPRRTLETRDRWSLVGSRLFGQGANELTVLDPATGQTSKIANVESFEASNGSILVYGKGSIRLLDGQSLSVVDEIPLREPLLFTQPRLLGKAHAIATESTIASFERHDIVQRNARLVGASSDESRIAVCDEDEPHWARIVDTRTWANIATFATKDTQICESSFPGLTADGRFLVGAAWPSVGVDRHLVPTVLDVATGKPRSYPGLAIPLSTALDSSISFSPEDPHRVCLAYGNLHWRANACPWIIDARGQLTKKPEPKQLIRGIGGVELARAKSDDGTRIVVASFDERPIKKRDPGDYLIHGKDLRVSFADASSLVVVDSVPIVAGDFDIMPPSVPSLVQDNLVAVTSTRAFFDPQTFDAGGLQAIGPVVVDGKTHQIRSLPNESYLGHGIAAGHGMVEDLANDRKMSLDSADTSSVKRLYESCPPPLPAPAR